MHINLQKVSAEQKNLSNCLISCTTSLLWSRDHIYAPIISEGSMSWYRHMWYNLMVPKCSLWSRPCFKILQRKRVGSKTDNSKTNWWICSFIRVTTFERLLWKRWRRFFFWWILLFIIDLSDVSHGGVAKCNIFHIWSWMFKTLFIPVWYLFDESKFE